jgi:hypothetical protein
LLRLLADDSNILEDSSGDRWPVQIIVTLLNQRFPPLCGTSIVWTMRKGV